MISPLFSTIAMYRTSRNVAKHVRGLNSVCNKTDILRHDYPCSRLPSIDTKVSLCKKSGAPIDHDSVKKPLRNTGHMPPYIYEDTTVSQREQLSSKQQSSMQQQPSNQIHTIPYGVDSSKITSKSDENEKDIPTNWIPSKNLVDSSAYFDKSPAVNWTPSIKYCSCKGGSGGKDDPNWLPPPQTGPATPMPRQDPSGSWIPAPQYFATDCSQNPGDHSGQLDKPLPGDWTAQYCASPDQPAGGSAGGTKIAGPKNPSNPGLPYLYDVRKYSPNLPTNTTTLAFEGLGKIPTGVFRCHTDECLGPAAQKGGYYQNPEYFAFHDMTYYDMHMLLREHRLSSPDTKRKL